jgi:hypothetical protein
MNADFAARRWGYKEIERKPQAGFDRVFFRKEL